ncbi:four helix bundle protein [Patescibacteria group bacterium]|nr:four helix bundle protein [Patescibacteria group bacterium]
MRTSNKEFSEEFKKRIYRFIIELIKFIEKLPKDDPVCRVAINQVIRSGTSMGANYVEAIAGSSKKEFTNYLSHSLKSSNETKFWLALLRDLGKCNAEYANKLIKELIEISNILGSSVRTMRKK